VAPELAATVLRALAKAPEARFASMAGVAERLDRFVDAPNAEPAPVERPRSRWGARAAFGAAVVALVVAAFGMRGRAASVKRVSAPAVTAAPARNAEALEAYRDGMQAYREGSIDAALRAFERATEIDDTFAAAHLRATILASGEAPITAHLLHAEQFRSSLSEKERGLLTAFEPWRSVPPDWAESERRMKALVASYPDDADMAYELGWVRFQRGDYPGANDAARAALRIDPDLGAAWAAIGRADFYSGDLSAARTAFERCVRVQPGSRTCIAELVLLSEAAGDCAAVESLSERLVALDPADPDGYRSLATARLALGRGAETVREVLSRYAARLPPEEREARVFQDAMSLAIVAGDFEQAERTARAWERSVDAAVDEASHFPPSRFRMRLALEAGRDGDAATLADAYLRRVSGWTPNDEIWSTSIYAVEVEYRSHRLSRAAVEAARTRWLDAEWRRTAATGSHDVGMLWVVGYAFLSLTQEDALEALDALPRYEPLYAPTNLGPNNLLRVGETYVLAGQPDRAEPLLRLAAQWCDPLEYALDVARARVRLGELLDARGDEAAACAQYEAVLGQWRDARPGSVVAQRAKERSTRLHCRG
jgi:serine/threonine-protein kinase